MVRHARISKDAMMHLETAIQFNTIWLYLGLIWLEQLADFWNCLWVYIWECYLVREPEPQRALQASI